MWTVSAARPTVRPGKPCQRPGVAVKAGSRSWPGMPSHIVVSTIALNRDWTNTVGSRAHIPAVHGRSNSNDRAVRTIVSGHCRRSFIAVSLSNRPVNLMKSRPCRVRLDPLQQASVDGSRKETTEAMS